MRSETPEVIVERNLSIAWGRAFVRSLGPNADHSPPLVLSVIDINNAVPREDPKIRSAVDQALQSTGAVSVSDNAYTIFPYSMWENRNRPDRQLLFRQYRATYPRLIARSTMKLGTYFDRMIRFSGVDVREGQESPRGDNQLEYILGAWERCTSSGQRPRLSALQVACFHPNRDHMNPRRRGFPCLQQVSFNYEDDGSLTVNAYYPRQEIYSRGYGNYVGLCHLGLFMAHEMGLHLERLNCFIGSATLGVEKSHLPSGLCPLVSDQLASHITTQEP